MHKLEKRRVAQHSNIADVTPAVSSTAQTSSSPGTPSAALLSSFQTQPTPRAVAVAFPVDNDDTTSETSGPQLLRMPLSRTLTPVGTTLSFDWLFISFVFLSTFLFSGREYRLLLLRRRISLQTSLGRSPQQAMLILI